MRVVEDREGHRFALVKRSGPSSLVLDLETGERTYRDNQELTTLDGDDIEQGPHDSVAELITALEDGPVPVRELIDRTTLCESELYALRRELEVAGALTEVEVNGERAWTLTAGSAATDQS